MDRRSFLSLTGLATASAVIPFQAASAGRAVMARATDWREDALLRPPAGQVVAGMAVTGTSSGSMAQMATRWKAPYNLTRVYGGTMQTLAPLTSTAQKHLDNGVVPAIDLNLSKQLAACGVSFTNPQGSGKTIWRWIADGGMDADFTPAGGSKVIGLVSQIKALLALTPGACPSSQVIVSVCHEAEDMNEGGGNHAGGTRSGTKTDYGMMMRHVVTLARSMGLRRSRCLWMLDGAAGVSSWGENLTDTGSTGFYPGHSYVDIVAWDPYNADPYRTSSWLEFSGIVNKFGQLDWWKRNFEVGGANTRARAAAGQGVYKPVMLAEFGTGDAHKGAVTPNAAGWFDKQIAYLSAPANAAIFRWVIYFNNMNTDVLKGTYRPGGFAGRGAHPVWARTA
jgi:hypothetical protein